MLRLLVLVVLLGVCKARYGRHCDCVFGNSIDAHHSTSDTGNPDAQVMTEEREKKWRQTIQRPNGPNDQTSFSLLLW